MAISPSSPTRVSETPSRRRAAPTFPKSWQALSARRASGRAPKEQKLWESRIRVWCSASTPQTCRRSLTTRRGKLVHSSDPPLLSSDDYYNTLIEIAEDSPATKAEV